METMNEMTTRAHSVLSPSGAEKWLNCPGSALLEQAIAEATGDDGSSAAAHEGTVAHALAAERVCARLGLDGGERDTVLTVAYAAGEVTGEMEECADMYAAYIGGMYDGMKQYGSVTGDIERRVDLSTVAPGCFGTADCILGGTDLEGAVVHIIDYKYGQGVRVPAELNAQLMLYAYGVLRGVADDTAVVLHIVQPRVSAGIGHWRTTAGEIRYWVLGTARPAAIAALKDGAECRAGEWCRFCRARGCCKALQVQATATGMPDVRQYRAWATQGYLRLMRGPVIDYRGIVDYINYLATCVRIRAIGYDAYDSLEVVNMLRNSGGEGIVRPVKQNNANFTAPVSAMEHAIYTGHVTVDDNPITRWCFANAVLDTDMMGNTKPVKRSEYQKIDGVITMLMSLRLFLDARR